MIFNVSVCMYVCAVVLAVKVCGCEFKILSVLVVNLGCTLPETCSIYVNVLITLGITPRSVTVPTLLLVKIFSKVMI